jgi:hypothetical protein
MVESGRSKRDGKETRRVLMRIRFLQVTGSKAFAQRPESTADEWSAG